MQIAFALYPGFTALDFVGPYQVLSNVPGVDVRLVAAEPGRVSDDNGLLHLDIELGLGDVPSPDIVVVPGGPGTATSAATDSALVAWVKGVHDTTTWTTSVCTGSLILGAAGVLDGLDATTHWLSYDELAAYGARPTAERVVVRGKVVTAAGVSSGIDMALTLVEAQWGRDMAEAIQLGIEYDPQPPVDSGSVAKARPEIRDLVTAVMRPATGD